LKLSASAAQITEALGHVSYGEAEEFVLNLMRREILAADERPPTEILREQLKIWAARAQNVRRAAGDDDSAGSPAS
jgi:hypothetical protein